jgi:hypothetical protein
MKKIVWIGLMLWSAGTGLDAAHASWPQGASPSSGGKEIQVCLELMDLEGTNDEAEDSMELPPLKSEKKSKPQGATPLGTKSSAGTDGAAPYSGKAAAVPDARGPVGLTPILLSPPGTDEEMEKLPMKPLAGPSGDEPGETGVSTRNLPGELKSPEPVDMPGQGLKMPSSAGKGAVQPVDAPEIPLLTGQGSGSSRGSAGDAPRGALTLKPAKAGSPGPGEKPAGAVLAADVPGPMDPLGGSELDDKLIAIYEKYYKNRK